MAGLLRYQIFLVYGFAFLAVWRAALKNRDTVADALGVAGVAPSHAHALVTNAPLWAVVALGIYAVASVGYGVATFADCPEAAAELDRQVKEAKAAMEKKGVKL